MPRYILYTKNSDLNLIFISLSGISFHFFPNSNIFCQPFYVCDFWLPQLLSAISPWLRNSRQIYLQFIFLDRNSHVVATCIEIWWVTKFLESIDAISCLIPPTVFISTELKPLSFRIYYKGSDWKTLNFCHNWWLFPLLIMTFLNHMSEYFVLQYSHEYAHFWSGKNDKTEQMKDFV